MISFAILIPAFNVRDQLAIILDKLIRLFPDTLVVVVDDGSSDDTLKVLSRRFAQSATFLRHKRNRGKGAAFQTGINYILQNTVIDAIIFIDGDGQHEPEDIRCLLDAYANKNGNFIIGKRKFARKIMPWPRIISNTITSKLISLRLSEKIEDSQCGFRLIETNLLRKIGPLKAQGFEFETEILLKAGKLDTQFCEVRVSTIYSLEKSNIRPFRDIFKFIRTYLTT